VGKEVWLPVNSSHGQLVTRSTRHAVDSSQRGGQLVTSKHQSCTAAAVITLTRILTIICGSFMISLW